MWSRTFSVLIDDEPMPGFVPFADMFNTETSSFIKVLIYIFHSKKKKRN